MLLTVINGEQKTILEMKKGQSVLDVLIQQDIYLPAICGGRGTCGKCAVRVQNTEAPITEQDTVQFSKTQIKDGYRLACKCYPEKDCTIEILTDEENEFYIVSSYLEDGDGDERESDESEPAVVVDIGTTTIAMELIDIRTRKTLSEHSRINGQRVYGADVITRIQAANSMKGQELSDLIREDLLIGLKQLVTDADLSLRDISKIVIAGNTTMCHLLLGFSLEQMGDYPFTPHKTDTVKVVSKELFDSLELNCVVTVLPCISAFIGGDVVAGAYATGFWKTTKPNMLIDFGTNAEIILGNQHQIVAASTAAGPAFEGGNISCGTGSVKGAISQAKMKADSFECETIGDGDPVGICGTGLIEIISELKDHAIIDTSGTMKEAYAKKGYFIAKGKGITSYISVTQNDIREFQLAKSAVRAAIDILLSRYGIKIKDVEHIYLVGGFGFHLNIHKAINIGLLPKEAKHKIKIGGDTALLGCKKFLLDENAAEEMERIKNITTEVILSNEEEFNTQFISNMDF